MDIETIFNTIFKQDNAQIIKRIAFSLAYEDYLDFANGKKAKDRENNNNHFPEFCDKSDSTFSKQLEKATEMFSGKAQELALETLPVLLASMLKKNNSFLSNVLASVVGTTALFCLMAGLSFMLLTPAEKQGMKPLQYIGKAIDDVLWTDNKKTSE